jgi:hypothetical protein
VKLPATRSFFFSLELEKHQVNKNNKKLTQAKNK